MLLCCGWPSSVALQEAHKAGMAALQETHARRLADVEAHVAEASAALQANGTALPLHHVRSVL